MPIAGARGRPSLNYPGGLSAEKKLTVAVIGRWAGITWFDGRGLAFGGNPRGQVFVLAAQPLPVSWNPSVHTPATRRSPGPRSPTAPGGPGGVAGGRHPHHPRRSEKNFAIVFVSRAKVD